VLVKSHLEIGREKMELPKIVDTVSTKEALELYRYLDFDYLVERIESHPENYSDRRRGSIRIVIFMGICP